MRQGASWRVRDNWDKLEYVNVTATGTSGGIAIVQVGVLQSRCVRAGQGASGDNCDKLEFVRVTAMGMSG